MDDPGDAAGGRRHRSDQRRRVRVAPAAPGFVRAHDHRCDAGLRRASGRDGDRRTNGLPRGERRGRRADPGPCGEGGPQGRLPRASHPLRPLGPGQQGDRSTGSGDPAALRRRRLVPGEHPADHPRDAGCGPDTPAAPPVAASWRGRAVSVVGVLADGPSGAASRTIDGGADRRWPRDDPRADRRDEVAGHRRRIAALRR